MFRTLLSFLRPSRRRADLQIVQLIMRCLEDLQAEYAFGPAYVSRKIAHETGEIKVAIEPTAEGPRARVLFQPAEAMADRVMRGIHGRLRDNERFSTFKGRREPGQVAYTCLYYPAIKMTARRTRWDVTSGSAA